MSQSQLSQKKDKPSESLSGSALIEKESGSSREFDSKEEEALAYIKTIDFWETFYRHDNFFQENNKTVIENFKNQGAQKGIEILLKSASKNQITEGLAKFIQVKEQPVLQKKMF